MTVKASNTTKRKGRARRLISLLMAIVLTAGLLPVPAAMAENADKPKAEQDAVVELMDAWYQPYVDKLAGWGVMKGDGNGNMRPEDSITRAEYCAMVNRAYGYKVVVPTKFTDVHVSDWFYEDIGIAYGAGYFKGGGGGKAYPNDTLTREEAAVIMARNMRLQPVPGESTSFTDGHDLSSWSKGYVEAIAREGIISGYSDGSFRPDQSITRAEMATMLARAINNLVKTPGEQSLGSVYGNLTINTSGVTLKDTVIAGDLYLTGGVGLGAVTLENVTVLGKIVVSGAGEANQGDSSVILRNTNAQELILDSIANNFVTLRTEGVGIIDRAEVRTKAFIDDVCPSDRGIKLIDVRGREGLEVQLAGNIKEAVDYTPYSKLILTQGRAETVTIDEEATGATMEIALGATVNTLNLDTGATVTGKGDVNRLNVNASGCIVEMLPDYITIRPGITAIIAGETMDTTTAMESSASPRILAGYPAMKNVAPTSATSVFQTNKKGTVYWALTAIADGSVTEEDLINPPVYGGAIIQSGHMEMPASNTDQTIPLTNLLKDGSYYVSAVLVDNRDLRSPVKVAAFTTPDDSTPDFATDPKLIGLTHERASVTVMPTKSCQLYYAVLPKGAVAPTIDEFKAGAVSGNLGYGSMSVVKNTSSTFQVSDSLEELNDYVLYLLLIDADGSKNSGIKTIDFTTPDGTPPEFVGSMTTPKVAKDSITLNTAVNEDATVYWVAVPMGTDYPVPQPGQSTTDYTSEYAKIQVENGMGSGKIVASGNVKVTGFKQTDIVVKGLKEATSYDIYYVAKDTAGNYSVTVEKYNENTLDETPPEAELSFSRTTDTEGKIPMADSDVMITFSENVMFNDRDIPTGDSIYDMYGDTDEKTQKDLLELLKKHIVLMDDNGTTLNTPVPVRDDKLNQSAWVDYTKVRVEVENSKTILRFPYNNGDGAIKLASGGRYHFVLTSICDTSSNKNEMEPSVYPLDTFTVAFAQVLLEQGADGALDLEQSGAKVHMDFTMTPMATESVDDTVLYDMYLWSEQIITFDLYARVIDMGTGDPAGEDDMSMFVNGGTTLKGDENGTELKSGWRYLGEKSLTPISGSGRVGASVYQMINNDATITNYPKLNGLKANCKYEFAISVVRINDSTEESTWSDNIRIWATIPAGGSSKIKDLGGKIGIAKSGWASWEAALNDGITSIGYDRSGSEFYVSRQFIDESQPEFTNNAPFFEAGDQLVRMNLMLNREGGVYYIVAPVTVSPDKTTYTYNIGTTFKDEYYDKTKYPTDKDRYEAIPQDGTGDRVDTSQTMLVDPGKTTVVSMVNRAIENGTATTDKVKYGYVEVGTSLTTIEVDGLLPNTNYAVYYVVRGTSQDPSNVHIFRFATGNVVAPEITLVAFNGSVVVNTSENAIGDWILFEESSLESDRINLGDTFFLDKDGKQSKYIASSVKIGNVTYTGNDVATHYKQVVNGYDDMTIIEALTTPCTEEHYKSDYSVFDIYANSGTKELVKTLVQVQGEQWGSMINNGKNLTTEKKTDKTVYCFEGAQTEIVGRYYFLAAMKNKVGEIYSYKAVGGVHPADSTPPMVDKVVTDITAVYDGTTEVPGNMWITGGDQKKLYTYTYNGTVQITFDEPIHMQSSLTHEKVMLKTEADMQANISKIGIDNVTVTSVSGSVVTLSFTGAKPRGSSQITFFDKGTICDENGNSMKDGKLNLTFTLSFTQSGFANARYKWTYGSKYSGDSIVEF